MPAKLSDKPGASASGSSEAPRLQHVSNTLTITHRKHHTAAAIGPARPTITAQARHGKLVECLQKLWGSNVTVFRPFKLFLDVAMYGDWFYVTCMCGCDVQGPVSLAKQGVLLKGCDSAAVGMALLN